MTQKWVIVLWEKWQEHQSITTTDVKSNDTSPPPALIIEKTASAEHEVTESKPIKLEQPREYKWLSWK